jgi:hypothetical protein
MDVMGTTGGFCAHLTTFVTSVLSVIELELEEEFGVKHTLFTSHQSHAFSRETKTWEKGHIRPSSSSFFTYVCL